MLNYTFTPTIITPLDGRELQTEQKYVVRQAQARSHLVGEWEHLEAIIQLPTLTYNL